MTNLNYVYLSECCAHEKRSKNTENGLLTCSKVSLTLEPHRSLQNLCAINLPGLRRES